MTDALNALTGNRFHLNISGFGSVLCSTNLWFVINFLNIHITKHKDKNQTSILLMKKLVCSQGPAFSYCLCKCIVKKVFLKTGIYMKRHICIYVCTYVYGHESVCYMSAYSYFFSDVKRSWCSWMIMYPFVLQLAVCIFVKQVNNI